MIMEITCINKIYTGDKFETFEYRDMHNDIKTIDFPKAFEMTNEDVEEYLMNNL